MVQVLKEETKNRIMDAARDAFFQRGFKSATLRDIAAAAGIPVGLIYTYFENKQTLFAKVVQPVHAMFSSLIEEDVDAANENPREDQSLFDELSELLRVFKTHRTEFLILIDKSDGTPFADTKQEIIAQTKMHIKSGLSTKLSDKNKGLDDLFYHILANNFAESILEIARHWQGETWAAEMLNLVAQQYFYGVNSF